MKSYFMNAVSVGGFVKWHADLESASFDLWQPHWRIPQPFPSRIQASILGIQNISEVTKLTYSDVVVDPTLKLRSVCIALVPDRKCSRNIRFRPLDRTEKQLGSCYVPRDLAKDYLILVMKIEWDLASRGR